VRPGSTDPDDALDRTYGYGFGEGHVNGVRVVSHDGGTYGVSATLSFLPDAGLTVVVLANDDPPAAPRVGARILQSLAYVVGRGAG
jgi:CubicO group peptidase (beta-lactamase class C family)